MQIINAETENGQKGKGYVEKDDKYESCDCSDQAVVGRSQPWLQLVVDRIKVDKKSIC